MIGELRQEKILVRYFRASSPLMHKYVLNIPITIVQQIMSEYAFQQAERYAQQLVIDFKHNLFVQANPP